MAVWGHARRQEGIRTCSGTSQLSSDCSQIIGNAVPQMGGVLCIGTYVCATTYLPRFSTSSTVSFANCLSVFARSVKQPSEFVFPQTDFSIIHPLLIIPFPLFNKNRDENEKKFTLSIKYIRSTFISRQWFSKNHLSSRTIDENQSSRKKNRTWD